MAATTNVNVNCTLVIGIDIDSSISKAIVAAKNGKRTTIITRRQITKLQDQTLREMRAGHRFLRKIISIVPASRYDLLKVMSDLYTWGENVPQQLFVDGVLENLKCPELVCAVAVDAIRACSRIAKSSCQLFVSVDDQYYRQHPDTVNFLAAHYFDHLTTISVST